MDVECYELAGSPEEYHTSAGLVARRFFLVPWEQRQAFARKILGTATLHGGRASAAYPGQPGVFAVAVTFTPADAEALGMGGSSEPDPARDLAGYPGAFARAVVEYRTLPAQDRPDGPRPPRETQLSYRMTHGVWERPLLASGFTAEDDPQTPFPAELPLFQSLPYTDHWLTWRQVIGPPWQAIRELQGAVNEEAFLGAAPGTLLFLGADGDKLFRGSLDEDASPFCWELRYHFRELAIKRGDQVFGWNHIHRADPPGFVIVQDTDGPLYPSGDFSRLFQPEWPES